MADTQLVIAHQLPAAFEQRIAAHLPPEISLAGLAPDNSWEVPEAASVLLAVPTRGANAVLPEHPPEGWPRNLKWIQTVSTGIDEYPKWIFKVPLVTCGRGANSAPIAEFVLASLLAVAKKLPEIWINDASAWRPTELGTLAGKTLGLIGYGSIGQAVAARARAFGMHILATRRSIPSSKSQEGVEFTNLDTVLAQADHLVIAASLTPATAGLIGRAALARVKPGIHLVNISRGRILDHAALLEALERGHVGFASLDVTEPEPLPAGHPLYTHPRVHLSPHLSWSDGERGAAFATLFAENLRRYRAGEKLDGIVEPSLGY